MKRALLGALLASTASVSYAQSAPTPTHSFTGNATVVSDYRFRGISQTYRLPAFQGGFDYAHASGFYLGNWNSNVSGNQYPNGASLEMDFYGGYKRAFGDFGLDVGYIYYYYPGTKVVLGNGQERKTDNQELYLGGSWKFITAKVSYALTNYFGLDGVWGGQFANRDGSRTLGDRGSSRGTIYYDLTAAYEILPKLTLTAHVGYTDYRNYNQLDYLDYRIGATYDLKGWMLGAAVVGTDADKQWWYACDKGCAAGSRIKDIGKPALVLSIGKTF